MQDPKDKTTSSDDNDSTTNTNQTQDDDEFNEAESDRISATKSLPIDDDDLKKQDN